MVRRAAALLSPAPLFLDTFFYYSALVVGVRAGIAGRERETERERESTCEDASGEEETAVKRMMRWPG
jgi:hypothetical protein